VRPASTCGSNQPHVSRTLCMGQYLYLEGCEGGAGLWCALPARVAVASLTSHAHCEWANFFTWKDVRAVFVWGADVAT
jgi:hypothetical protein